MTVADFEAQEPSKLTAGEEAALWDVIRGAFHFLESLPAAHGIYPPAGLRDQFRKVMFGNYACPVCQGPLELGAPPPPGVVRSFRCSSCRVDVMVCPVLAPPERVATP